MIESQSMLRVRGGRKVRRHKSTWGCNAQWRGKGHNPCIVRIPAGNRVRKKKRGFGGKRQGQELTSQVPEYGQEGTTSEAGLVSAKGFFRSQ